MKDGKYKFLVTVDDGESEYVYELVIDENNSIRNIIDTLGKAYGVEVPEGKRKRDYKT